jgi:hypothetical protein
MHIIAEQLVTFNGSSSSPTLWLATTDLAERNAAKFSKLIMILILSTTVI